MSDAGPGSDLEPGEGCGTGVCDAAVDASSSTSEDFAIARQPWAFYEAYLDSWNANRPTTGLSPMSTMSGVTRGSDGAWIVDAPSGHVVIENRIFYPSPGGYALIVRNQRDPSLTVYVRNCVFVGGAPRPEGGSELAAGVTIPARNGWGIKVEDSMNVHVHDNWFENIERVAIDVVGAAPGPVVMNNVAIFRNRSLNMQAFDVTNEFPAHPDWPIKWESKFIQLRHVIGSQLLVWDNRALNLPGWSFSTDFINLYESSGTEASPIRITSNKVIGAGEFSGASGQRVGSHHLQGAGMQLGDHEGDRYGGQYIEATHNVFVFPGPAGMNINGGYGITMSDNAVIMADSYFGYSMNCDPAAVATCGGTPVITSSTPWTAMSIYNYSGREGTLGAINGGHVLRNNRVSCPACAASTYLPEPWRFTASGNVWNATLDPVELVPPAALFAR